MKFYFILGMLLLSSCRDNSPVTNVTEPTPTPTEENNDMDIKKMNHMYRAFDKENNVICYMYDGSDQLMSCVKVN